VTVIRTFHGNCVSKSWLEQARKGLKPRFVTAKELGMDWLPPAYLVKIYLAEDVDAILNGKGGVKDGKA
jgi:hypothetical protein